MINFLRQTASFLIKKFSNGKVAVVTLGIIAIIQIFLATYVIPNIFSREPEAIKNGLLIMVDGQPFASAKMQYEVFNLYKPDILGYVRLLYAFDFLIPLSLTFFFASLIGVMLKRLDKAPRFLILLVFLPVIFDYFENSIALFLIAQNPARTYLDLASFEGIVTALKLASSGLVIFTTISLFLVILFKKKLKKVSV